jgi:hypothetical protein
MMNRKSVLLVLSFLIALPVFGQAPYRDYKKPTTRETLRQPQIQSAGLGILDPSRISMNHSFGMGYSSMGGNGASQGYYMNTISYRFNSPVLLRIRTGIANNSFSNSISQPGQSPMAAMFNDAQLFGGADLLWKPKENIFIKLSFDRAPASMMGYPGGYGYGPGSSSYYNGFHNGFYGYGNSLFRGDEGFNQISADRN